MYDVGDVACSRHTFTGDEFAAFAAVTGDHNPIHHDPAHAAETEFGAPIVPLAMVLGPVSALIGMVIPGPGAVILDTAFRPVRAVAFDREVVYSLRVRSVGAATGTLTCRVLAYQDRDAVLDGEVTTTLTVPRPRPDDTTGGTLLPASARQVAVVTGAAGDIGSAVARALAGAGWDLALVCRASAGDDLAARCRDLGARVELITADLGVAADRVDAAKRVAALSPTALVHAAAPPLAAGHGDHLEVGYAALRDLADAALDGMLLRQRGGVVLIGSEASRYHPRGWSDYVAAKAAAATVLSGLDRHYGGCGVRAVVIEPGFVSGRYSAEVRPRGLLGLMPEEVADAVVAELADLDAPAGRVWLTPEGATRFALDGAAMPGPVPAAAATSTVSTETQVPAGSDRGGRLAAVVRGVLGLPSDADVRGGGVGLTAGWDSLRQIQIVLAVEAEFGIRLPAAELASAGRFDRLCAIVEELVPR
ncbi:Short-chain dehydrogenase [Actinokineospora alba]|uniref:Short-chain dehydrogenase n=1 Tax=Actinokineospora alba TaxID=504798 RepID=A0A1H0FDE6_9PSEU|nr:SDR family NAD(P)-dependent oxidoreductase [Actinokineospora alba]TDP69436.1 short-subunit dehydrogenase [Actinokineospora alba]SDI16840.1 Short-chain dehydrogenase [Actinokineospora alba]SDN92674.1 Short-chain dehydrogenase [Actinokineospora alba]